MLKVGEEVHGQHLCGWIYFDARNHVVCSPFTLGMQGGSSQCETFQQQLRSLVLESCQSFTLSSSILPISPICIFTNFIVDFLHIQHAPSHQLLNTMSSSVLDQCKRLCISSSPSTISTPWFFASYNIHFFKKGITHSRTINIKKACVTLYFLVATIKCCFVLHLKNLCFLLLHFL